MFSGQFWFHGRLRIPVIKGCSYIQEEEAPFQSNFFTLVNNVHSFSSGFNFHKALMLRWYLFGGLQKILLSFHC
jgi:hypothetical protein